VAGLGVCRLFEQNFATPWRPEARPSRKKTKEILKTRTAVSALKLTAVGFHARVLMRNQQKKKFRSRICPSRESLFNTLRASVVSPFHTMTRRSLLEFSLIRPRQTHPTLDQKPHINQRVRTSHVKQSLLSIPITRNANQ
jgi:hypothetical protein